MTGIQIIISDKSPLILRGLSSIIEKISIAHELHTTNSSIELIAFIKKIIPDLVIVNPELLDKNQIRIFKEIIQQNKIKFIVLQPDNKLTDYNLDYDEIISSCENEDQILKKINSFVGEKNFKKALKKNDSISTREENIVREIALGLSNKEIAEKLFISQHTVITHRKNITRKLGIKSVSGLTIYAILNKLISLDEVK